MLSVRWIACSTFEMRSRSCFISYSWLEPTTFEFDRIFNSQALNFNRKVIRSSCSSLSECFFLHNSCRDKCLTAGCILSNKPKRTTKKPWPVITKCLKPLRYETKKMFQIFTILFNHRPINNVQFSANHVNGRIAVSTHNQFAWP